MRIDRHNYEEFFILYWDNELTASEKQAVENFVTQNADLRVEFDILGEARLTADATVQFKEKDLLLNNSFINITNYEEQLLNYIDDEITATERKEVEKFIGQNAAAQKELALFQKTKLQPEADISFPDKSVLYRREENTDRYRYRVISMTWFRVAAAAAIVLIAGLTVFQLVNTGANVNPTEVVRVDPSQKNTPANNKNQPGGQTTKKQDEVVAKNDEESATKRTKTNDDNKKRVDQNLVVDNLASQKESNNLPTPGENVIADGQSTTKDETAIYPDVVLDRVDEVEKYKSGAISTSFTDPDVTNKPKLALYIPDAEVKEKDGGGLKEFFRKTTRVFERRTKIQTTTEDNKLLVGAFAVSLK